MTKPAIESVSKSLVVNDKHEALILKIGVHKAKPERSFTSDLPGGLVDPGETEIIAAIRELEEETAIILDESAFQLAYAKTELASNDNKSVTKFLYLVELDHTPEVILSWEHASYEWVPLDAVLNIGDIRPFYREAIEYCFASNILSLE